MRQIIVDGNEACVNASYMFTEVAGIYPITPSSTMPEIIDKWSSEGKKNLLGNSVSVTQMQSEAGAIGFVHGSLQAGILTSTYTASQGLILMTSDMYKIAGEMLPGVIHVAARTVATHALSIFGDHSDVYQVRDTGFCMLASTNVQDAYYMALVAHLSAIKGSLPFLHFFDGFRTSHEFAKINVFDKEVDNLIDKKALFSFRKRALNINNPVTRGTNQNGDIYFQVMESRNKKYLEIAFIVEDYMNKINELAGTNYKPFNYYGSKSASKVIIAMGSVCDTIKETIDYLGGNYGLIEVHLYRPFSAQKLLDVLPKTVKYVAVLDRAKDAGSNGEPLYLDVLSVLNDFNIKIVHGRYGLSSKDTTMGMIKSVYDNMDKINYAFTIGINDDVTNLSLSYENIYKTDSLEYLFYGFGSDGMVSCAKSIIDIAGKKKYVQGYFEYDSRKSGGVTVSHLRFDNKYIRSSYFVANPKLVVISKDIYLKQFDALSNIRNNGILLVNTGKTDSDFLRDLGPYKKSLISKGISVFTLDANRLADSLGLGLKISMIMESAILSLMDFIDYDDALIEINSYIKKKFMTKGSKIVEANLKAVNMARDLIHKVSLDIDVSVFKDTSKNLYEMMMERRGNELHVSDVMDISDGTVLHSNGNKFPISNYSPIWDNETCIQCGMCSLVCPHGVIRTFYLDESEYSNAPLSLKNKCVKAKNLDYYFVIGVASNECTGCGVCINTCPSHSLKFDNFAFDSDFEYLVQNVKEKDIGVVNTIKGSQAKKPKFAFHGACAGCGQTAYIKLLTQLFGDNLIIANATGCSSIYGASMPSIPYEVPWANSLFEDNAEFGFGILEGYEKGFSIVCDYMTQNKDKLFKKWLDNPNSYDISKYVYDHIDYKKHSFLKQYKNFIIKPMVWTIGGDGWAYDIGFGGIDHVLSSGKNVNILVLDTQVYSNTGGQSSKATPIGATCKFASTGKKNGKKDLASIAMCYENTYVAQVSLGANMMQTIKAFTEAANHDGPSIIIAYAPCISHGIIDGMGCSVKMEKLATDCGYFPIFRYNGEISLDCNPDFSLYDEFLSKQTRYAMLKKVNPKQADELYKLNKEKAIKRFEGYKKHEG